MDVDGDEDSPRFPCFGCVQQFARFTRSITLKNVCEWPESGVYEGIGIGALKDMDVILLSASLLGKRTLEVYEHLEDHSLAIPRHEQATSFPLSQIKISTKSDFGNLGLQIYRPFLADWDLDAGSKDFNPFFGISSSNQVRLCFQCTFLLVVQCEMSFRPAYIYWLVVWNIFYFPCWEE